MVRNDEATWDELRPLDFDNVVISPGPGRPDARGGLRRLRRRDPRRELPLLGVCLGHQGLARLYGGDVVHAPELMHGRLSAVVHDDSPLFAGIPRASRWSATTRSASRTCLRGAEPDRLDQRRRADGLAHRERPLWGVQFHPESICTEYGRRLLANFRDLSAVGGRRRGHPLPTRAGGRASAGTGVPPRPTAAPRGAARPLFDPEQAFRQPLRRHRERLLARQQQGRRARPLLVHGRAGGPLAATITYDVGRRGARRARVRASSCAANRSSTTSAARWSGCACRRRPAVRLQLRLRRLPRLRAEGRVRGRGRHRSSSRRRVHLRRPADRLRPRRGVHLPALPRGAERGGGGGALDRSDEPRLASLALDGRRGAAVPAAKRPAEFTGRFASRPRERYLDEIDECRRLLAEGETYEVCLTNKVRRRDRRGSAGAVSRPAPGSTPRLSRLSSASASAPCSAPRRSAFFASAATEGSRRSRSRGRAGAATPAAEDVRLAERLRRSEKNRAENLMIGDLIRNDLGSVCEVGSVRVPALIEVEAQATVHQLVTTVCGRLRESVPPAECIRACFPPGSMTGAPRSERWRSSTSWRARPAGCTQARSATSVSAAAVTSAS